MNESTKTKKALRGSLFALFLCIVLLIGTTFAWFTDTASTGVNKIQSGKLDVELEYSTDMEHWNTVTSSTKLFDDKTLWEPGVTELVYLRVKNNGNLALKYQMAVNPNFSCTTGTNVNGESYKVWDYLKIGTADVTEKIATREAAWSAIENNATKMNAVTSLDNGNLAPNGQSNIMALVIYMPTDVGNEANAKSTKITGSDKASYFSWFGVNVYATQDTVESDSFDNEYDKNAPTKFTTISSSSETLNITGKYQANGRWGVIQAERNAHFTVDADVYAVYKSGAAMAVDADGNSTVVINGGDFRQVSVPSGEPCDLIYALGHATVTINGGTFKATTPANTLNVNDSARGKAKIIVNGGKFYKYDPSNPAMGPNEVFLGEGCKVTKDGDWYVVSR